jgi:hypothetical protein
MKALFFKMAANDFIHSIKEYYESYTIKMFKEYESEQNFIEIFEIFSSEFYQCYKHSEAYNLYGSMNIRFYIYSYNKEFYSYLLKRLKKEKTTACKNYSKYLSILLRSNLEEQTIVISEITSNDGKFKMIYKDNNDVLTERIISNINFDDYSFRKINAFCHLRNAERNFNIKNIIKIEHIKKKIQKN